MRLVFAQYVDDSTPNQDTFLPGNNPTYLYRTNATSSPRAIRDPLGNYKAIFDQNVAVNDFVQATIFIKENALVMVQCKPFISDATVIELNWINIGRLSDELNPGLTVYNYLATGPFHPSYIYDVIKINP